MHVKNWRKTIGTKEKSDEKGEQIVDISCNVRLAHISMNTIRDNVW